MIQVYSASHPTEAHLVKGMLETEGIESEVRGDVLFGARGELPLTSETAPSVWIKDRARFEAARKIVQRYEKRNREEHVSDIQWECESCGEVHGEQFSHCWKCGMRR